MLGTIAAEAAPGIAKVAPEVLEYVDGEIAKLRGRQRCTAAVVLATAGLVGAAISLVSGATDAVAWAGLCAAIGAAGAHLVARFCPG